MQLLAFKQTPADAPAQLRIAEVVEDKKAFVESAEFAHRPIEMIARTAGQQIEQARAN
jgi:hypothetical protein